MKKYLGMAAGFLVAAPLSAATVGTTFNVTTSVVSACSVSAANLAFGNYDPLSVLNTDGTTTVTVTCSLLAPYNIGFDTGLHGSSVSTREMQLDGETETIGYGLYRDALRTLNWGNTVGTDTLSGVGTGLAIPTAVYGRISAQQNVPVGSYADTITVTVTY